MTMPAKTVVILGRRRSWMWLYVVGLALMGVGLGFVTSALQKRWHRADFTTLHVTLWWVAIGLAFLWYAERPSRKPAWRRSAEQDALAQRLAILAPLDWQAFTVSCLERLHVYERDLGGPEDRGCVAFRETVLTEMWAALQHRTDFSELAHLKYGETLLPDPDACPAHAAAARIVDEFKMQPFLDVLANWPPTSADACFELAMHVRDYIDQIVMDQIAAGADSSNPELAQRIVAGAAWRTAQGLRSHPLMNYEVSLEYADLDLLESDGATPKVFEQLRKRSAAVPRTTVV
jgi:hypothetical protein